MGARRRSCKEFAMRERCIEVLMREVAMRKVLIYDDHLCSGLIRDRLKRGIDRHDKVWDGVYVIPPTPTLPQQRLVTSLSVILAKEIKLPDEGRVLPAVVVSDRRTGWKTNYRIPDIVVVLPHSRAVDCKSHFFGGPDFLVEVDSREGEVEEKLPFYGHIGVRELLRIDRETRRLRIYRNNGDKLGLISESVKPGKKRLQSNVLPLAFRWKGTDAEPRTEVTRTDGERGTWTV
jgi:Uma2 family endonuclease